MPQNNGIWPARHAQSERGVQEHHGRWRAAVDDDDYDAAVDVEQGTFYGRWLLLFFLLVSLSLDVCLIFNGFLFYFYFFIGLFPEPQVRRIRWLAARYDRQRMGLA